VLKHKWFDLGKCLATHVAGHEGDSFDFRNLFSLKYKEEVPLHKLVIKLITVAVIDVGLVNNYAVVAGESIGHVSINRVA
jgi:hypothetical protein